MNGDYQSMFIVAGYVVLIFVVRKFFALSKSMHVSDRRSKNSKGRVTGSNEWVIEDVGNGEAHLYLNGRHIRGPMRKSKIVERLKSYREYEAKGYVFEYER